jgi:hypothetical protein
MQAAYLKNTDEILDDDPVVMVELIPSQFQGFVGCDLVNCCPVSKYKPHHIICRVPSRHNITRDKPFLEIELTADAAPSRESDCS